MATPESGGIIIVRRFECYDPGSLLNDGLASSRSIEDATNRTDESLSTLVGDAQTDSDEDNVAPTRPGDSPTPPPAMLHSMLSGTLQ